MSSLDYTLAGYTGECLGLIALVGRAVRRRHCVGGCAPVNFGRRRRAAGPKKSAAASARRVRLNNFLKKYFRKKFVLSSKFSDDLF